VIIDGRPDPEAVRARIVERVEREPQLRRTLRMRGRAAAEWVDAAGFDVRDHVRVTRFAAPISGAELRHLCARLMEERLDRSRPLWAIDVLGPLEDGGLAVVWKIHHSMADGATAMRLAHAVLWDTDVTAESGAPEGASSTPLDHVRAALRARRPGRVPGVLRRELRRTRRASPLDGTIGSAREVGFTTVPLGAVKRAAKKLAPGATVNDAVLALVAGGLRSWAQAGGGKMETLRVKVPVSLHRATERHAANRDSFFCASLPLTEVDPAERLRRISADTALRKRSGDALVLDAMLRDLGRVAPPLRRALERLTLDPGAFALNVSNVAGPAERPQLLGAPVRALFSVAEIRERHGLRIAVVSMADVLHFGLCADPTIVGALDPLLAGIAAEANVLRERAG
jgi:diacylglycerol O-acyltransferase / wax synthase